ncbi:hypothetical protein D3C71_996460 [compost metagenome]
MQLPKARQLPLGVGDVVHGQRCEQPAGHQPRNFGRIGGHQIKTGSLRVGQLGTQHIVRGDGGDLHLGAMALLENRHDIGIGIPGPGQHTQHRRRMRCRGPQACCHQRQQHSHIPAPQHVLRRGACPTHRLVPQRDCHAESPASAISGNK